MNAGIRTEGPDTAGTESACHHKGPLADQGLEDGEEPRKTKVSNMVVSVAREKREVILPNWEAW